MKAKDHTDTMLRWWRRVGVDRADLAVRRSDGAMLWHHDQELGELPLGWARAENVRGAEVYVRPARGYSWPLVLLDDVTRAAAHRVAGKYGALVVQTSPAGGCHTWLLCRRRLDEPERAAAQRWLAQRIEADPASTSGEHLGRLAGFKNWKRDGCWVNLLRGTGGVPWDPAALPADVAATAPSPSAHSSRNSEGRDASESGREWGWVCGRLEAGCPSREIYWDLLERARERRGRDAARYARHTLLNAMEHVAVA